MAKLLRIAQCETNGRIGDVVFVHGLDGDAESTWHPRNDPTSFWPSWLAADFPELGTWSLDYDAKSLGWTGGGMPLIQRATQCVDLFRLNGLGGRPLVLVTHSLGGLLAKQMIRGAYDTGSQWLSNSVRGVVFLATPHTGSKLANWVDNLGNYLPLRRNEILKCLRDNDSLLLNLNQWYRDHVEDLGIESRVFYEECATKSVVVVDRAASDPGIPRVVPIPLDADHVSICKPKSRHDHVYLGVKQFIEELLIDSCVDALPQSPIDLPDQCGRALKSVTSSQQFDVFLSHNSKDKPTIRKLAKSLKQRGLSIWLDEEQLAPGQIWQAALEDIIRTCRSSAVCVGEHGLGPWEEPEMYGLLRRFVDEKKRGTIVPVIPVMLPGAPAAVELPLFLKGFVWVDLRRGISNESLDRFQWGITGVKPNTALQRARVVHDV